MAAYRQVHITFWQDPFIEELSPKQKYFYIYLMTNSKTQQCGCYEISMRLVRYETGLQQEEIDSYIKVLVDNKKIDYNEENQEFIILNWLKHNSFKSPKVKTCILKELVNIKTVKFKDLIESILKSETTIDRLLIDYGMSIDTGSQKEEEKEEEKNNKKFTPPTLSEVEKYILEKQYVVDPKFFFDYFESREWVNSQNKPVANWKNTIVTWNNNELKKNPNAKPYKKKSVYIEGEDSPPPPRRDDY